MDNQYNFAYIATVHLGTPPQPINAIFDTGSANMWVVSTEANGNRSKEANSYNPGQSETFVEPEEKQTAKIQFGSGSLEGYFANDVCEIGIGEDGMHVDDM